MNKQEKNKKLSMIPLPVCSVDSNGKVIGANRFIDQVFLYSGIEDSDFFALTGVRISEIAQDPEKEVKVERNGKIFRLIINRDGEEENANFIIIFEDVTGYEALKKKYLQEKTCVCRINVDNYEELIASVEPETGMSISTEVDRIIRKWAAGMESSVEKPKNTLYTIYLKNMYVEKIKKEKFSILDKVREIETEADFPLSLSMGLGIGGRSFSETSDFAGAALDLALGRGGDQAVIKEKGTISYYGGKTQTVEKSNKGKSRIVGHALKKLIEQSGSVYIMGHKNADMDAFGAALGVYRMCINADTEANIVIDRISDSLEAIYRQVKETEEYNIITTEKAKSKIEETDLLVVVDTHNPGYIEEPELLEMTERVVVIDHHRRSAKAIESPALSYIETYASSASELVAEMIQFAEQKRTLVKLEAEALLAGMTVDTNRFAVKTGVRTFEAAAWLRRAGADTTEVKRFFQTDIESFKVRSKCIAAAKFYDIGIATSICEGKNEEAQVINAQVADELLNVKGVQASFVAGKNNDGITCISARSLGEVNVQIIVEQLGGGGHLTTAGAQVDETPEEVISQVLGIAEKMLKKRSTE